MRSGDAEQTDLRIWTSEEEAEGRQYAETKGPGGKRKAEGEKQELQSKRQRTRKGEEEEEEEKEAEEEEEEIDVDAVFYGGRTVPEKCEVFTKAMKEQFKKANKVAQEHLPEDLCAKILTTVKALALDKEHEPEEHSSSGGDSSLSSTEHMVICELTQLVQHLLPIRREYPGLDHFHFDIFSLLGRLRDALNESQNKHESWWRVNVWGNIMDNTIRGVEGLTLDREQHSASWASGTAMAKRPDLACFSQGHLPGLQRRCSFLIAEEKAPLNMGSAEYNSNTATREVIPGALHNHPLVG